MFAVAFSHREKVPHLHEQRAIEQWRVRSQLMEVGRMRVGQLNPQRRPPPAPLPVEEGLKRCYAAFSVCSPCVQLQGHSSSVCSASSTRSTSAGLRPTLPSVT